MDCLGQREIGEFKIQHSTFIGSFNQMLKMYIWGGKIDFRGHSVRGLEMFTRSIAGCLQ